MPLTVALIMWGVSPAKPPATCTKIKRGNLWGQNCNSHLYLGTKNVNYSKKYLRKTSYVYTWTSASGCDSKIISRTPKGDDIFSKMNPSDSWM